MKWKNVRVNIFVATVPTHLIKNTPCFPLIIRLKKEKKDEKTERKICHRFINPCRISIALSVSEKSMFRNYQ